MKQLFFREHSLIQVFFAKTVPWAGIHFSQKTANDPGVEPVKNWRTFAKPKIFSLFTTWFSFMATYFPFYRKSRIRGSHTASVRFPGFKREKTANLRKSWDSRKMDFMTTWFPPLVKFQKLKKRVFRVFKIALYPPLPFIKNSRLWDIFETFENTPFRVLTEKQ